MTTNDKEIVDGNKKEDNNEDMTEDTIKESNSDESDQESNSDESESSDQEPNDYEVQNFHITILNELNKHFVNNSIPFNSFHVIGVAYSVHFVLNHIDLIIKLLALLSFSCVGIFVGDSFFKFYKELNKEEYKEPSFQEKYDMLINQDKDKFIEILQNPIMKEAEYTKKDEDQLKTLKKKEHHFENALPYDYNKSIILFYDYESESFQYYTKNSDIQYEVLNAICRSYVVENKCVNLYKDAQELKEILGTEHGFEEIENVEQSSSDEEPQNMVQSLFYKRKTRSDTEKEKRKKMEQEKKKQKTINKFIYKGNMDDYIYDFKLDNRETTNNISYENFKKQQESEL